MNSFISLPSFKKLGFRSGREIPFFKALIILLSLIFFILALAGPQWGETYQTLEKKSSEMIFLLDTSLSMNAQDLRPNRLEMAKNLIINISREFKTDYISLINFAGTAYVQCPLTIDYEAFNLLIQATQISPAEEQGTNFVAAFEFAINVFKNSQEDHKLIVLITDGEDHSEKIDDLLEDLSKKKVVVFTVGVGSLEGAPVPIIDEEGKVKEWKKDRSGNIVKSKLNITVLKKIANKTNGLFFRLADLKGIEYFVSELKKYGKKVLKKRTRLIKINRFYYPLILGIMLLLLDLFITERKIKWKNG